MTIEDDVRSALRSAAEDVGHPAVPHRVLAAGLQEAGRHRKRRRLGFAAAGLAVAVVVAAVPVGIAALRSDPPSAAAPTTASADVLGVHTRGSMAQDQTFLDAVVQLGWTDPDDVAEPAAPVAPVDTRRVVFAGDVPGGRWALVVGQNPEPSTLPAEQQSDLGALSEVAGLWFVGPEGASPEEMAPATRPRGLTADQVQALSDPSTGTVVVVAAPGDVIGLSDRPEVAADGTVSRRWTDALPTDGVAVGHFSNVPAASLQTAGQYRVTRDGIEVQRSAPDQFAPPEGIPVVTIPIDYPRGQVADADLRDQQQAADLLGRVGLPADQVRFQVVWSGAIPGPDDDPTWAVVLVATLPSGAQVVQGYDLRLISPGTSATQGPTYGGGQSVFQVFPAGTPAPDLVVAMRSDVSGDGGTETASSLVVVVPDGVAGVTALGEDGIELGSFPVSGGAAVAPFPAGTTQVAVAFPDGVTQWFPLGSYTGEL